MRFTISLSLALLVFGGCANREGVTPSQNPSLQAVSPNTAATSEGGMMQRSLDNWLKEEWAPMTNEPAKTVTKTVTTTAPDGTVTTKTVEVATPAEAEDDTPFTLQKYADKWKVYQENKAKMNEGKPKEPSHMEEMQSMPVIGK